MELRFCIKYVACAEQPDGKTPKMQGRLLPPLGDDGPDDDPLVGKMGQPAESVPKGAAYISAPQTSGIFAMVLALSLQDTGTVPCLHCSGCSDAGAGQPVSRTPL